MEKDNVLDVISGGGDGSNKDNPKNTTQENTKNNHQGTTQDDKSDSSQDNAGGDGGGRTEHAPNDLNWRRGLEGETLKAVIKFKTPHDLAKAYLNEKASKAANTYNPSDTDGQVEWLKKAVNPKKEIYDKINAPVFAKEEAEKVGIPPKVLEVYEKGRADKEKEVKKDEEIKKVEGYKKEILQGVDKDKLNRQLNSGLNAIGLSPKDFSGMFGPEALNPKVIKGLAKIGKKVMEEGSIDVKEFVKPKEKYTSDPEELKILQKELILEKTEKGVSLSRIKEINKELKDIAVHSYKISQKKSEGLV